MSKLPPLLQLAVITWDVIRSAGLMCQIFPSKLPECLFIAFSFPAGGDDAELRVSLEAQ